MSDYKYKYKASSADIRIGDLWGKTYRDNEDGVSALISYTKRGDEVIRSLKGITLIEHPFDVVAEGQMKENARQADSAFVAKILLKCKFLRADYMCKILFFADRCLKFLKRRVLRKKV